MGLFDAHAHVYSEPDYVPHLLAVMDAYGISKAVISGIGPLFHSVTNRDIAAILQDHPYRFIGAFFVQPGIDSAEEIRRAYDLGFRVIKVTAPRVPYDDPSLNPLWNEAQELQMPVLFHSGIITTVKEAPGERINSWFTHPMRIEPITREFPSLNVIIAHMGVHWNDDATELARMRPNVFLDITGEPGGWRTRADAVGFDRWLWWPGAWKKVVFGTDVHYSKIQTVLKADQERFHRLKVDAETQESYFSKTLRKILGEK